MISRQRRRPASAFCLAFLLGALTWGAWLGWDRSPSYDVVTGSVQSPYVTLQVLGCAVTFGVVAAVLAARWSPAAGAGGTAAGFWLAWTIDAASQDETGLFAVGAVLLAGGLAAGVSAAAAVGVGVRAAVDRRREQRRRPS